MPIAVLIVTAFCMLMGLAALIRPQSVVGFISIDVSGKDALDARNEVRAVYGGFGIALAAVLIFASRNAELAAGIYLAVGMAFLGMGLGRLVSFCVEPAGFWPRWAVPMELCLAGLLFWQLR